MATRPCILPKSAYLNNAREATPKPLMELSIHLYAAVLSISNTVSIIDIFGVERVRSTVHNWVQKADLQPANGKAPNHVAVDETAVQLKTVIQLDNEYFWLVRRCRPRNQRIPARSAVSDPNYRRTKQFLAELQEKHRVGNAVFPADGALWLHAAIFE